MASPTSPCVDCLLVDGDLVLLTTLVRALERAGHHCTLARRAREAVALVNGLQFDCFILGTRLPDGTGLAAAERLRRPHHHQHIVLMGGEDKEEFRQALRDGVIDAYVQRTIDAHELAELVTAALRPFPAGHTPSWRPPRSR